MAIWHEKPQRSFSNRRQNTHIRGECRWVTGVPGGTASAGFTLVDSAINEECDCCSEVKGGCDYVDNLHMRLSLKFRGCDAPVKVDDDMSGPGGIPALAQRVVECLCW